MLCMLLLSNLNQPRFLAFLNNLLIFLMTQRIFIFLLPGLIYRHFISSFHVFHFNQFFYDFFFFTSLFHFHPLHSFPAIFQCPLWNFYLNLFTIGHFLIYSSFLNFWDNFVFIISFLSSSNSHCIYCHSVIVQFCS